MEPTTAQAPEAAPAESIPAQSTPATETAPAAPVAPAVANAQSADSLPMDFESIDNLFTGNAGLEVPTSAIAAGTEQPSSAIPVTVTVAPAPEPAAVPQGVTPAAPAPQAPAATETDPAAPTADDRILPNRIPTKNLETRLQAAIKLQHDLNAGKNPGDEGYVPFDECYASVKGIGAQPQPAAPAAPQPSEVESVKVRLDEARTKLTDLEEQRREMTGYGSDTSELDAEIAATREALDDARMDFKLAQRQDEASRANQAAAEAERQAAARADAKAKVVAEFPSVAQAGTPLANAVAEVIAEYRQPSHPDNALLFATNAARHVLREALSRVAEKEGTTYSQAWDKYRAAPSAPAAVVPATVPATTEQQRRVMPASGAFSTTPPAAAMTEAELLADVGSDPDKAGAALGYGQGTHYIW